QVTENFSDYTVGGKLAEQAQAMGRDYWTTWASAPGGAEDGTIAEVDGNKVGSLTYGNDQVLLLGGKTSGVWDFSMKMYVPTGKCGYFNILANFAGTSSTWALQVYLNDEGTNPGAGYIHAGASEAATFTFDHDSWVNFYIQIDLDTDNAVMYVDDVFVYEWVYTAGSFGAGCPRIIDAMNIFPPTEGVSDFYIDDIVFEAASDVIFETNFDELTAGAYVAQSYPEWWRTWNNTPGTAEDGLISTEQASSTPNSAKLAYDTDLIFLTGDQTTGAYTIDFDMYIPNAAPAYFNLLHTFAGTSSEWAIGVHFNVTGSDFPEVGTYVQQNGEITNFTYPDNTWFPVSFFVDLSNDNATLDINGTRILEWQFSLTENGGAGLRQLGAADFFPPQTGALYYIDNFVFAGVSGGAPSIAITPNSINKEVDVNSTDEIIVPVTITNTGSSMADYTMWPIIEGEAGNTESFTLTYCNSDVPSQNYYNQSTTPPLMEFAAKFTLADYCEMVGTYITKISFFLPNPTSDNSLTGRVYGQGTYSEPGEILSEATISGSGIITNYWNEITLPEPVFLDGQDFWVAFEGTQPVGTSGLMSTDAGPVNENGDWRRTNGGSWGQLHVSQPELGNGNFMIKAFVEGDVIPGCWFALEGETSGSVLGGSSATIDVVLDAQGLAVGTYNATLYITSNDPENDYVDIPVTLTVKPIGIEEYTVNGVTTIVYPNPATDMITVESNKDINSLQVINSAGQVIYSTKAAGNQVTVNTSSYSSGVYFIKTTTDAGSKSIKFIVK
ncbi:T9SS type A sorting domain-containing protein, partial [Bacteroidales bacterium OttesenSCG-928-K22]|nr:T9SS type A sorting domain-containing protein [Bacteroidales bacterium OttesenSCG-928-K22]